VGRTLVANRLLGGSACGKRQRVRPLNSVVRQHSDMWPWIRIVTVLAAILTGPIMYNELRAEFENELPSWSFVAAIVGFGICSTLFVLAILNAQSQYAWSKPSWYESPIDFRQPAQLIHMAAWIYLAVGLSTAVESLILGARNFMFLLPLSLGIGTLLGLKLAVGTFDRFESENAA
jgi:hypothetical protein